LPLRLGTVPCSTDTSPSTYSTEFTRLPMIMLAPREDAGGATAEATRSPVPLGALMGDLLE
jgi:hypothetical protein